MNRYALPNNKILAGTGVALMALGLILLLSPMAAGEWVIRLVSVVLVITGAVQMVQGFRSRGTTGSLIAGLLGVIVAAVGALVWFNPELGSGFLTALLMIFFTVHGRWKVSTAFRFRQLSGWIWLLVSGVVSLAFVYLLFSQWPMSGATAIGILVGLDLLLTGVALMVLARAVRRVRRSGYVETISLWGG